MIDILPAKPENASELAFLINLAGEGIPEYFWNKMAEEGDSALDFGTKRAAREEGNFSYLNARVALENTKVLAMILGYRQPENFDLSDIADYPEFIRPLLQLETKAPNSWYINAIATFEEYRGKGIAKALMKDCELQASVNGCDSISLIVASENKPATRLYEDIGFNAIAGLPVITYPGCAHRGKWILMIKELS